MLVGQVMASGGHVHFAFLSSTPGITEPAIRGWQTRGENQLSQLGQPGTDGPASNKKVLECVQAKLKNCLAEPNR